MFKKEKESEGTGRLCGRSLAAVGPAGFGVSLGEGGLGRGQLSPFPHLPLNHLQKKKQEQCLQSTLSTVPLTLWMPNRHREPLLPWAPRDQGAAAGPASSRFPH